MRPGERVRRVCRLSAALRRMALAAIRRGRPELDEREARIKLIEVTYGEHLASKVRAARKDVEVAEADDLVLALRPVAEILQSLQLRFYIGGSVASSFHGALRSTMDVDLVCELTEADAPSLIDRLGDDYYASEPAIRDAIRRKSCFNLIHLPTSLKVDVFVSRGRPFDIQVLSRAQPGPLGPDETFTAPIATAEDIIVLKLEWYRLGGETSERQWDDVSRLAAILEDRVDKQYLERASELVGVGDLLRRLM